LIFGVVEGSSSSLSLSLPLLPLLPAAAEAAALRALLGAVTWYEPCLAEAGFSAPVRAAGDAPCQSEL
jgi:hypothetical protein